MKKPQSSGNAKQIAKLQSPHGVPNPIVAPKRIKPNVQAGSASVQGGGAYGGSTS